MIDRLDLGNHRERRITGTGRIETDLEQLHEAAGDLRMSAQRVFHIGLAEADSGLPHYLGAETQNRDLTRRQAGGQDQTVEPVVLDPARPHRHQRLLEAHPDRRGYRAQQRHPVELEFVDPHCAAIDAVDAKRLLGDDPQAEVLQDRQHVGKDDRLFGAINPAIRVSRRRPRDEANFERRTRQHRLDPAQIGDRLVGLRPRLVGYRKRLEATQPSRASSSPKAAVAASSSRSDQLRPASASRLSSVASSTTGTRPVWCE